MDYKKYEKVIDLISKDNYIILRVILKSDKSPTKKFYILYKIKIKNDKELLQISNEVNRLKSINSKYIIKIYDFFTEQENGNKYACILIDNYREDLSYFLYHTNILKREIIWKIFLQLIFLFRSYQYNNICLKKLTINDIALDEENNIKFIKIGDFIVFNDFNEQNSIDYISPEIRKGLKYSNKCNSWSLGCILYKLLFMKEPIIDNDFYSTGKVNIPYIGEEEFRIILSKLLCLEDKRASIQELLENYIIKNKLIEENLFNELSDNEIQSK